MTKIMQKFGHIESLRGILTDWNLYDMSLNTLFLSAKLMFTVLVGSVNTSIARSFKNGMERLLFSTLVCVYFFPDAQLPLV